MKLMRPISLVLLCIAFVPSLALGQTAESKNRPAETVKKAPETAAERFDFWLKAANSGSALAMEASGQTYEDGWQKAGIEQDIKKAIYWYEKAANANSTMASYRLSRIYRDGKVIKKNEKLGAKWLLVAAELGTPNAQYEIGRLYEKGRFRQKNDLDVIKKFINRKDVDFGNIKFGDEWHRIDKPTAAHWYLKAATQGHSEACDALSEMYEEGIGVPKDIVEAYKWKNLTYIHDTTFSFNEESWKEYLINSKKLQIKMLERQMSPSQIALAQRLSTEFKPKRYKKPSPDNSNDDDSLSPDTFGSGFYVTSNGYLLTNQHVVDGARKVFVYSGSKRLLARVVKTDAANDLALLKVDGSFDALPVSSSRRVKLGQTVSTIGFPNPDLQGKSPKLTKGEISSLSGASDDPKYFQISVPLQPGNSGGPLVDAYGNVIGVVTAKLSIGVALAKTGDLPENVNYAVKGTFVMGFLESVPDVAAKMLDPKPRRSREFTEVVSEAEKASVMILVYE